MAGWIDRVPVFVLAKDVAEDLNTQDPVIFNKWQELYDNLKLPSDVRKQLEVKISHGTITYKEVFLIILKTWLAENAEASMGIFIKALIETKLIRLAAIMKAKYGENSVITLTHDTNNIVNITGAAAEDETGPNSLNPSAGQRSGAGSVLSREGANDGTFGPPNLEIKFTTLNPIDQQPQNSVVIGKPPQDEDIIDFFDNEEPLVVNVKEGTKFQNQREDVYLMRSEPRGYALIINNIFPGKPLERSGGDQDTQYMKELFRQLKYECLIREEVDSEELPDLIKKFQKKFQVKKVDSCVVVVMSHGERDKIIMADEQPVPVTIDIWNDLVWQFDNKRCPILQGIPKIFIIQACQGNRTWADANGVKIPVSSDPKISDIIVCLSTSPGHVSLRDKYLGTWYIYCLTKVLMENAHEMHLEDMLRKLQSEMPKIRNADRLAQVCTWNPFQFKKFYFNPGI